jgi:HEXXH motif-containing protein
MFDTDPGDPFVILPPAPELSSAFRERLGRTFELLDAGHPELAAEIRELVREIVIAVGPDEPGALDFDGASSFMLWGAIALNGTSHATPVAMAQALAHESGHNLLFGLSADGPLVANTDDERFGSPLRVDERPMDGVYHATFVCARMHQALHRLLDSGKLDAAQADEARRALENDARLFGVGLETVERNARLTPMGEAALAGARAWMAPFVGGSG